MKKIRITFEVNDDMLTVAALRMAERYEPMTRVAFREEMESMLWLFGADILFYEREVERYKTTEVEAAKRFIQRSITRKARR